jgi:hypothetical protein
MRKSVLKKSNTKRRKKFGEVLVVPDPIHDRDLRSDDINTFMY